MFKNPHPVQEFLCIELRHSVSLGSQDLGGSFYGNARDEAMTGHSACKTDANNMSPWMGTKEIR